MSRVLATLALALPAPGGVEVQATAYSPCSSGTVTASGERVHVGIVAANWLPLGTRIRVWPPAFGRTRYVVEDRSGWGTSLDIWTPSCSAAWTFGRRLERVEVLGR